MNHKEYVVPFPGSSQSLSKSIENGDIMTVTREALDAIDVLRPAWEPLSAEVVIFGVEGENPLTASLVDVARPHRLLLKASVVGGVLAHAVMVDPLITTENELTRSAIEAWIESALIDVVSGPDHHASWSQLRFDACRARVGPADWRSNDAEVRLQHEGGSVVVPVERDPSGAWLSGPREPAPDQPPTAVRLANQDGFVTLQITRHYSYWVEPDEVAAQQLNGCVDLLRARGWND